MRDFRDAKAMAQTLRDSLHTKAISISHGESLELVSKMFGLADWNTLSALLHAGRNDVKAPPARAKEAPQSVMTSYPAVPLRDLVPFPTATYPLFVGRPKTMQALDQDASARSCWRCRRTPPWMSPASRTFTPSASSPS
jgi:ATP-dependent Lon protease